MHHRTGTSFITFFKSPMGIGFLFLVAVSCFTNPNVRRRLDTTLTHLCETKEDKKQRITSEKNSHLRHGLVWSRSQGGKRLKKLMLLDDYSVERIMAGLAPSVRNDIYRDLEHIAEQKFTNGKVEDGERLLDWGEEHFPYEEGNLRVLRAELYLQRGMLSKCSKTLVEIAGGESTLGDVDWSMWTEQLKDFYVATVMEQADGTHSVEKSSLQSSVERKNFFVESPGY